jgi:hypothetical protein
MIRDITILSEFAVLLRIYEEPILPHHKLNRKGSTLEASRNPQSQSVPSCSDANVSVSLGQYQCLTRKIDWYLYFVQ